MSNRTKTVNRVASLTAVLLAGSLALSACGGGGAVDSIPPPPPAPPPAPPPPPPPQPPNANAIIPGATTTQELITSGALPADQQVRIRYDAEGQYYEIQLPGSAVWERLTGSSGDFITASGSGFGLIPNLAGVFTYSAAGFWNDSTSTRSGLVVAGVATPSGAVPTTGSATYVGTLIGGSAETSVHPTLGNLRTAVTGSINLAFDFGAGTLTGSASPILSYAAQVLNLPAITFTETVYSSGSTSFYGRFATSLPGPNGFSGRFTGPAAQELIGNFAFPYTSPVNGQVYGAAGAIIAKKP